MGRLFQYNRFGAASTANNKKDTSTRKSKKQEQQSVNTKTSKAMGATAEAANNSNNSQCQLYAELYADYATSEAATTTSVKNMEFFAYRKYQQWGNKLLHAMPNNHNKQQQSENAGGRAACCHEDVEADNDSDSDTAQLLQAAADSSTKRPRVYDCMKDFLRRKFFQQQQHQQTTTNGAATTQSKVATAKHSEQAPDEDDVTSDYEELDILDSSYNADEEDATDCSCSYSSEAAAPSNSRHHLQTPKTTTKKSLLSLNCWHTVANSSSSSSGSSTNDSSSSSDDEDEAAPPAQQTDDSDAGISDCCQLLPAPPQNEQSPLKHQHRSPKRSLRKTKQRKTQHRSAAKGTNANIEQDLLDAVWYQPCWSSKTTQAYLHAECPGTFIVRRKARQLELCLRTPSKVKCYAIVGDDGTGHFKLKGARKQFSTLKALVTHHSVMAEQLPLTLLLPRERDTTETKLRMSVRCADDFVGIESLEILDILKSLQAKQQPEVSLIVW